MWNFSVFRALGLMMRTLPQLVVYGALRFGVALLILLATGVGAGIGHLVTGAEAGLRGGGAPWGAAAGFLLAAIGVLILRRRHLFPSRVAQIALMVEALEGRKLPFVRGQAAFGRSLVASRFGSPAMLEALDRLIRGVVRATVGLVGELPPMLPLPVLDRLTRTPRSHLWLGLGLVDAVVLAYAHRARSENAWEAAHDGLVLYMQNARSMLMNAAWLNLLSWVLAVPVFLAALAPAARLAALWPPAEGGGPFLAALFAWAVRGAVFEPLALACMLQVHVRVTEGQEPQPEWRGRMTQVSDRFRHLGEQAIGWAPTPAQDA